MPSWRAIADILVQLLTEILRSELVLQHRILRQLLLLRLRGQYLRLHTKAHVLIDKMSLWRRSGEQLVPVTHGERLPVIPLPLDARERLVKLATEIIDLRFSAAISASRTLGRTAAVMA